jgi:hypothetical protein
VVSIFLFTPLQFLLYDFILRRLQTKVMDSAKRRDAMSHRSSRRLYEIGVMETKESGHISPQAYTAVNIVKVQPTAC